MNKPSRLLPFCEVSLLVLTIILRSLRHHRSFRTCTWTHFQKIQKFNLLEHRFVRPLKGIPFFLLWEIILFPTGGKRNAFRLWGFPAGVFLCVPYPLGLMSKTAEFVGNGRVSRSFPIRFRIFALRGKPTSQRRAVGRQTSNTAMFK